MQPRGRLIDGRVKGIGVFLGLRMKLLPSLLRRSAIKHMARHVPQRHLKYMVGHLSDKTASKYYDGLTDAECADVLDAVHGYWDSLENLEERENHGKVMAGIKSKRVLPPLIQPKRFQFVTTKCFFDRNRMSDVP